MGKKRQRSLNQKLALIVVAAVLTAAVLITAASLWREARRHTESKVQYLSATAAVFASASSRATADGDAAGARAALRGVVRAPHLTYARIETADGALLAEIGSGVTLDSDAHIDAAARTSVLQALQSGAIEVTQPIVQSGEQVGRIRLVAENGDLWPALAATMLQALLGAAIALALGLGIASRLHRWMVRPLLHLTEMVRKISQSHDYSTRVDIETDDEVGELCGGINEMMVEILARERKIIDLAHHDSDTDLPNRVAFERAIATRLQDDPDTPLAVFAVGVDRFHYVRGVIGYAPASDLLAELGVRLDAMADLSAARIGTDMIGVAVAVQDVEHARARALIMLVRSGGPVRLGVNEIDVNLSMGVAVLGEHAQTPQTLIERASIALDQARAAGIRVALFDEASYAKTARNLSLMADMARALENGEMSIHLQPKFDIRKGAVTGAEALARWRHPKRGMVPPDEFVGMAEEMGGIGALTEWVLRETIACQGRLAGAGAPPALAVNLSGRLLGDVAFVQSILPLLQSARGEIYLEITETATIDNQESALGHIAALVGVGARISIDDYGSGLSSLAYLKRIPAQELKIDQTFITALGRQQRDALLVKSTIDLAHSLGMQVTAEGVETEEAYAALAAMGCDCVQGYLIARPMPEAEFARFLRDQAPRAAEKLSALRAPA